MANSIITAAGLALFAQALKAGTTVPVDRMIFADIPGLDTDADPDPYKEGKGLIRREQAGHARKTAGGSLHKTAENHCAKTGFRQKKMLCGK